MRPYVVIFATETLDGKIALSEGFTKLSCYDDFVLQHMLRREVDAVMVGANTVIRDDPRLTVRLVPGKSPARIIVDSRLRAKPSSKIFTLPGEKILITSKDVDDDFLAKYIKQGVKVIKVDKRDGLLNLREALNELAKLGIRKVMVEGGGILINSLLDQGLVDEVRVTVAPRIFGRGIGFAASCNKELIKGLDITLNLREVKIMCGGWIHLVYAVLGPKESLY